MPKVTREAPAKGYELYFDHGDVEEFRLSREVIDHGDGTRELSPGATLHIKFKPGGASPTWREA